MTKTQSISQDKVLLDLKISPSVKQREFFLSDAKYTAYGGARGGGKSWALRNKLILMCLYYPGLSALLVRRSYPEVMENHKRELYSSVCCEPAVAKYNVCNRCFDFVNGSRIKLGYFKSDEDVSQYQGREFDVIAIDEATQITEQMFRTLAASVRGTNNLPKRMYLSCNPGGIGHGWVKRLFVRGEYKQGENPDDYRFISASVYDNDALMKSDPDYVKRLENLPQDVRRAWLDGDWDVFSGRFFPEFSYETHTLPVSPVPEGCERYCALDYGLDMLAALFIAVKDGCAVVYDEIYESSLIASEAAAKIKEKLPEDCIVIAPSDLWSRQKDSGLGTAELFARGGVYFTRLAQRRESGWLSLKEWLKPDVNGHPRLTIFRNCKNLIRCLCQLSYSEKNPCDAATSPHEITHAPDALRYFASYLPLETDAVSAPPQKLVKRKNIMKGI